MHRCASNDNVASQHWIYARGAGMRRSAWITRHGTTDTCSAEDRGGGHEVAELRTPVRKFSRLIRVRCVWF